MAKDSIYDIEEAGEVFKCQSKLYEVNNPKVKIHVVEVGPSSGKPMLLIHGFPDFWYLFRYV